MKKQLGFTFMEIMVVVIIIGVLAAIAIPSYQNSVNRTYRSDAQAALVAFASSMERWNTETNSYCDAAEASATAASANTCREAAIVDTGNPRLFPRFVPRDANAANAMYQLIITDVTDGTFTLTAQRMNPGRMANDECGDFTLTSAGQKNVINTLNGLGRDDCWVN